LRLFSIGGYGLALATLALVVFGAYDSYPTSNILSAVRVPYPKQTLMLPLEEDTIFTSAKLHNQ